MGAAGTGGLQCCKDFRIQPMSQILSLWMSCRKLLIPGRAEQALTGIRIVAARLKLCHRTLRCQAPHWGGLRTGAADHLHRGGATRAPPNTSASNCWRVSCTAAGVSPLMLAGHPGLQGGERAGERQCAPPRRRYRCCGRAGARSASHRLSATGRRHARKAHRLGPWWPYALAGERHQWHLLGRRSVAGGQLGVGPDTRRRACEVFKTRRRNCVRWSNACGLMLPRAPRVRADLAAVRRLELGQARTLADAKDLVKTGASGQRIRQFGGPIWPDLSCVLYKI